LTDASPPPNRVDSVLQDAHGGAGDRPGSVLDGARFELERCAWTRVDALEVASARELQGSCRPATGPPGGQRHLVDIYASHVAPSEALDTEYESGVADVLAFLAGAEATVERNVKLPGRRSGTARQIDILIRGRLFAATDAVAIVDCKRWTKPVDVADVGAFLDLVEDVGADVGLLVSTQGGSTAAHRRATEARGVRLQVMSLGELAQWAPQGTFSCEYRIPAQKQIAASRVLRRAGFRVAPYMNHAPTEDEVVINVFQHYGTRSPTSEQQTSHWDRAVAAMANVAVTIRSS
jgi:Restriction endonuclease